MFKVLAIGLNLVCALTVAPFPVICDRQSINRFLSPANILFLLSTVECIQAVSHARLETIRNTRQLQLAELNVNINCHSECNRTRYIVTTHGTGMAEHGI
jgi:hypothetical protein